MSADVSVPDSGVISDDDDDDDAGSWHGEARSAEMRPGIVAVVLAVPAGRGRRRPSSTRTGAAPTSPLAPTLRLARRVARRPSPRPRLRSPRPPLCPRGATPSPVREALLSSPRLVRCTPHTVHDTRHMPQR
jgi:hypothetical protein